MQTFTHTYMHIYIYMALSENGYQTTASHHTNKQNISENCVNIIHSDKWFLFCIFLEVTIVLVAWSLLVSTHSSVSGQAPQSPPGVLTAGTQATLPRSGFVKKNR